MITSKQFIEKAVEISKAKTAYMWGTYGRPITDSLIERKKKQYPLRYTSARVKKLKALVGKGYFGFDCVGLIKGLLWGWDGKIKVPYNVNGVPDTNASGMRNRCTHRSKDFSLILPGCLLHTPGHVGIYIGGGLAVEATPKWKDGVQITAVANIGKMPGYNSRRWSEHGRLPWIDYADVIKPEPGGGGGIKPKKLQIISRLRLRIRSGPGTDYKKIGSLKPKAIVEVTDTKPGKGAKLWGYVPAKKGWISLDYTKDAR